MTESPNRKYIAEVDHLRAYAAVLVVAYHGFQIFSASLLYGSAWKAEYWIYTYNPFMALLMEGHTGVGLFITLSGFILSLGCIGHRLDYGRFLAARFLRIYPLVILLLIFAIYAHPAPLSAWLQTALLLTNLPGAANGGAFTNMFWAVGVEFQIYFLFPFFIAFSNRLGSSILFRLVAVVVLFRLLTVFVSPAVNPVELSYWTIAGRIDQFCIGMIAARAYIRFGLDRMSPLWFLPAAATTAGVLTAFNALGGFHTSHTWKVFWPTVEAAMWAFFIVAYLPVGRLLPRILSYPMTKIGEVSYSLYLGHFLIITLLLNYGFVVPLTGIGNRDALLLTFLLLLPAALILATLLFKTIELPFLQLRPRYILADAPEMQRNFGTGMRGPTQVGSARHDRP